MGGAATCIGQAGGDGKGSSIMLGCIQGLNMGIVIRFEGMDIMPLCTILASVGFIAKAGGILLAVSFGLIFLR